MLDVSLATAAQLNLGDPILIGSFWGFVLSLLIAPFLVFWMSAVKNRIAVIIGAILGSLLAFIVIWAWAGTLINVDGASVFFGSALFCSAAGIVGGMAIDLLIGRWKARDYRQQVSHE